MSSNLMQRSWNRREILAGACLLIGGAARPGRAATFGSPGPDSQNPYSPFKMGLQSYSLRGSRATDAATWARRWPRPRSWVFITGSRTSPTYR